MSALAPTSIAGAAHIQTYRHCPFGSALGSSRSSAQTRHIRPSCSQPPRPRFGIAGLPARGPWLTVALAPAAAPLSTQRQDSPTPMQSQAVKPCYGSDESSRIGWACSLSLTALGSRSWPGDGRRWFARPGAWPDPGCDGEYNVVQAWCGRD